MRVRRLAAALAPQRTEYQGNVLKGRVTAVTSSTVTLDVRGTSIPGVRYPSSLAPAVDDIAYCVRNDVDLFVQYFA